MQEQTAFCKEKKRKFKQSTKLWSNIPRLLEKLVNTKQKQGSTHIPTVKNKWI